MMSIFQTDLKNQYTGIEPASPITPALAGKFLPLFNTCVRKIL